MHRSDFPRYLKNKTNRAYSGYDWTFDGIFSTPRVKGRDKRRRTKYERTVRRRHDRRVFRNNVL